MDLLATKSYRNNVLRGRFPCVFRVVWPTILTQMILPIPSGVVITASEPIREIEGFADIYVTLEDRRPFHTSWLPVLRRTEMMLNFREVR